MKKNIVGTKIKNGEIKSCGCLVKNNLVGKHFGKLTVLYDTQKRKKGHIIWHCKCECGNECDVNGALKIQML